MLYSSICVTFKIYIHPLPYNMCYRSIIFGLSVLWIYTYTSVILPTSHHVNCYSRYTSSINTPSPHSPSSPTQDEEFHKIAKPYILIQKQYLLPEKKSGVSFQFKCQPNSCFLLKQMPISLKAGSHFTRVFTVLESRLNTAVYNHACTALGMLYLLWTIP